MASTDDMTATPPARLDRRKVRTRKALMNAALDLLDSRGYDEVMTDEITECAEMGRRTFYNHFVSKQDCYLAALKNRFAVYADDLRQSLDPDVTDPALMVAHMAPRMFRLIALDPVTEKLIEHPSLLTEAVADSQRDHMAENVADGLLAERFKTVLPIESLEPILASGFIGLVTASIRRQSQEDDSLLWGRFVLLNLGISEEEADALLEAAAS